MLKLKPSENVMKFSFWIWKNITNFMHCLKKMVCIHVAFHPAHSLEKYWKFSCPNGKKSLRTRVQYFSKISNGLKKTLTETWLCALSHWWCAWLWAHEGSMDCQYNWYYFSSQALSQVEQYYDLSVSTPKQLDIYVICIHSCRHVPLYPKA